MVDAQNTEYADFQVARGAAPRLAGLRAGIPAADLPYAPTALTGLPSREWAIADGSSPGSSVIFTLGDDVIQVADASHGRELAEAIIGQAF